MRLYCQKCQRRFPDGTKRCPTHDVTLRVDPFIGRQIGDWRLTGFIGRGAMGVVYRAEPTAAIKILNASRAAMQPDLIRRFEVEATAALRLDSPHIAQVFEQGTTDDGHLYIAMELLRGAPLDELLARFPVLAPEGAATIAYQAAHALAEAHAKSIVHRDLKPANLFVEPAPGGHTHIRVLDFGIARINSESVARSRTGSIAGTPAYMSPEQLQGLPDIDGRSDIYSLGVVLYTMLAGVNPFRGPGGIMGALRRHTELIPDPLPPNVPPALAELTFDMMAKHRDVRIQTMEAIRLRIEATGLVTTVRDAEIPVGIPGFAADGTVIEQQGDDGTVFVNPPAPVAPKRRRAWPGLGWWLTAVALAAGIGVGAWFLTRGPSEESATIEPATDAPATAADEPANNPDAALRRLRAEIKVAEASKEWATCHRLIDRALPQVADQTALRALRDRCVDEARNQRRLAEARDLMERSVWHEAERRLMGFPAESVYGDEAQALRAKATENQNEALLERLRRASASGNDRDADRTAAELERRGVSAERIDEASRGKVTKRAKPRSTKKRPRTTAVSGSYEELIGRALRSIANGDRSQAIRLLEAAARKKPRSHVPYQRLCAVYKSAGVYGRALRNCKKWLDREPNGNYKPAIRTNIEQLEELLGQ